MWRRLELARSPYLWGAVAYVVLRTWQFWHVFSRRPVIYPDSADYLRVSSLPLWSSDFYTSWKPFGLPLFYKLLPGPTTHAAPAAQWTLSVASWLVLALVVSRRLRSRALGLAGYAIVLLLSASPLVSQWDGQLLTESLTLSLAALLVAVLLVLVGRTTSLAAAGTLVLAGLLIATRDTNAYLVPLLLIPVSVALVVWRRGRLALVIVAATVVMVGFSGWSYSVRRWETPMADVIWKAVIPNPPVLAYFEAHGMPAPRPGLWTALVETRTPPSRFETDPRLAFFRPWFLHHATRTYFDYLASHPRASLWEPIRNMPRTLSPATALPDGLDFYRPTGFRVAMPRWLARLAALQASGWTLFGWLCLAGGIGALLAVWGLASRWWLVPALLLASTVPHGIVIWDGDPTNIGRHALSLAVLARAGFWLLTLFVLDVAVGLWSRDKADSRTPVVVS